MERQMGGFIGRDEGQSGLKAAESGHQGAEGDSGRECKGATAESKIKVGLDQCHYCKITSESVREGERKYVAYINQSQAT